MSGQSLNCAVDPSPSVHPEELPEGKDCVPSWPSGRDHSPHGEMTPGQVPRQVGVKSACFSIIC